MKAPWLAALTISAASTVSAQELIIGAGVSDFSAAGAESGAVFEVEYHTAPMWTRGDLDMGLGAVLSVHQAGDVFVGGGAFAEYNFQNNWFAQASFMPGAYFEDSPANDLGQTLEFRTQVGVGYRFDNGTKLSLAFAHTSNASLGNTNPGMNTWTLRWHKQF
ncbi:hypothetical protein NBRC116590_10670 [Pelagimonas sp. KU-00592-HH]|uniref:acyloxyacyl hydrolase n=1 Tax=Pelagimonas sp. KU-00592-HH TaxID=3127651 RepID=UPI003106CC6F